MFRSFEVIKVLDGLHQQSCIAVDGVYLAIGSPDGTLSLYRFNTILKNETKPNLIASHQKFSRKPITQLLLPSGTDHLIVLSQQCVSMHRLGQLFETSPEKDLLKRKIMTKTQKAHFIYYSAKSLYVCTKKKIQVFKFHPETMTTSSLSFVHSNEINVEERVSCIERFGDWLLAACKKSYKLIHHNGAPIINLGNVTTNVKGCTQLITSLDPETAIIQEDLNSHLIDLSENGIKNILKWYGIKLSPNETNHTTYKENLNKSNNDNNSENPNESSKENEKEKEKEKLNENENENEKNNSLDDFVLIDNSNIPQIHSRPNTAYWNKENDSKYQQNNLQQKKVVINWKEPPVHLIGHRPFILASFERSPIQIRTCDPRRRSKWLLGKPYTEILGSISGVRSLITDTSSHGSSKLWYYISNKSSSSRISNKKTLMRLNPVKILEQVDFLISTERYSDAYSLSFYLDSINGDLDRAETKKKRIKIQELLGFQEFAEKKKFLSSAKLLANSGSDFRKIVTFFPNLIPKDYLSIFSKFTFKKETENTKGIKKEKENENENEHGNENENENANENEKKVQNENRNEFSNENEKEKNKGKEEGVEDFKRWQLDITELDSNQQEIAIRALLRFLIAVREKKTTQKIFKNNPNAMKVFDTIVLKCMVREEDKRLLGFIRNPNHKFLLEISEKELMKYAKDLELVELYWVNQLYSKAIGLLERTVKNTDQIELMINYLTKLDGSNINLIFDYSDLVIEKLPIQSLTIFTTITLDPELKIDTRKLPFEKVAQFLKNKNSIVYREYLKFLVEKYFSILEREIKLKKKTLKKKKIKKKNKFNYGAFNKYNRNGLKYNYKKYNSLKVIKDGALDDDDDDEEKDNDYDYDNKNDKNYNEDQSDDENELKEQLEKFHTELLLAYLNQVLTLKSKLKQLTEQTKGELKELEQLNGFNNQRTKLEKEIKQIRKHIIAFIQGTNHFNIGTILMQFPRNDLFQERIELLKKFKKHKKAVEIIVNNLNSIKDAKKYCHENYSETGKEKKIFTYLVYALLKPTKTREPNVDLAIEICNEYSDRVDPIDAIKCFPNELPIKKIHEFLQQVFCQVVKKKKNLLLKKNLLNSYYHHINTELSLKLVKSQKIDENTMCNVCCNPIGYKIFNLYPNGVICHHNCQKDDSICPYTGVRFEKLKKKKESDDLIN
ncbi:cnh domain containing [Anaeramoeba flamelloides]|uniref:Cnh domain containing n=1 Tax=Anaeramoeba flamelloides TaxID=1746091 RepID=A0AAV8ACQ5_9EUKA|nr:cnh domain containing [Anaeramoeba flamelloides]